MRKKLNRKPIILKHAKTRKVVNLPPDKSILEGRLLTKQGMVWVCLKDVLLFCVDLPPASDCVIIIFI